MSTPLLPLRTHQSDGTTKASIADADGAPVQKVMGVYGLELAERLVLELGLEVRSSKVGGINAAPTARPYTLTCMTWRERAMARNADPLEGHCFELYPFIYWLHSLSDDEIVDQINYFDGLEPLPLEDDGLTLLNLRLTQEVRRLERAKRAALERLG